VGGQRLSRGLRLEVRGKAVAGILEQGSLESKYGVSRPMPDLVRGTDWEPTSQGILVPGVGIGAAAETMGSPFSHSKWGRAVSRGEIPTLMMRRSLSTASQERSPEPTEILCCTSRQLSHEVRVADCNLSGGVGSQGSTRASRRFVSSDLLCVMECATISPSSLF
jgi:hypothetical protein